MQLLLLVEQTLIKCYKELQSVIPFREEVKSIYSITSMCALGNISEKNDVLKYSVIVIISRTNVNKILYGSAKRCSFLRKSQIKIYQ